MNYSKIQFSEAVDTTNYEIGIFYSIVTFKNQSDYNSVMPRVSIHPNLPDIATNAEIIELQDLINSLNADTKVGLEDLAEIINTQTSQIANMPSNPYGVYVNNFPSIQDVSITNTPTVDVGNFPATQDVSITNFPQQTLSPSFDTFTTASSDIVSLNLPDSAHYVMLQNLSSTSVNIGNNTVQPFVLSPMGLFEWSSDNNGLVINPSEISAVGSSGLKLAIVYA